MKLKKKIIILCVVALIFLVGALVADKIISKNYFNEITGQHLRVTSKTYHELIRPRLREGFTVDDFKTIIDKKYAEWHGTEFEKFIRPSTLFAPTHFEDYLNQPKNVRKKVSPQDDVKRTVFDPSKHKLATDEYGNPIGF